jgi:nucleotide-binding universal stress UspA family protein
MPAIKKILFPVDFSDSCAAAARYVEALAGQFEAELMLLHVVNMGEHTLADELLPVRRELLDKFLVDELKYYTTQRVCVTGETAERIVETAASWAPDLICMPSHGLGVFRRMLLGSVTAKILNDVECPVWTGVHLDTPKPLEEIHCKRILCALDLTDRSLCVLEWAAWLAGQYGAELAIAHATPQLNGAYYGYGLEQEFAESVAAQASEKIDALQTAARTDAQVLLDPGSPAAAVSCAATRFDADLLVMGRHSNSGLAGFLRPNAYSILRESPCPAITI